MTTQLTAIKAYIFPGIVTVLGMMIWNDVTEIKADVKALMAQSNIDKTRIDALERSVYSKTVTHNFPRRNDSKNMLLSFKPVAWKPDEEII